MTYYCYFTSPIGKLLLVGTKNGLAELHFPTEAAAKEIPPDWQLDKTKFTTAIEQLEEYFAGRRKIFDLKLAPSGTPFQLSVWQALQQVPYGTTASYGEIARKIGNPKACRAIGMANHHNPLPIVIPCHRIIGKDGSLTGFGGGLDLKRQLLELEGYVCS
jgi:methylated-DNA-[protein]-cysteine S-methyltransferase